MKPLIHRPEFKTEKLLEAQEKARALFTEIEQRKLIQPGITELDLGNIIYNLAQEKFGIRQFWHKRIIRAGENTLHPYRVNPPNRMIEEDDIVFLDLGPVFEEWEADFGRTYVLGSDPDRLKIKKDVEEAFAIGKAHAINNPDMPASELFHFICDLAKGCGWEFGAAHAGHLVGQFPHERVLGDELDLYIHPENHLPLSAPDPEGGHRFWILEIHFIDSAKLIGGFHEELLNI